MTVKSFFGVATPTGTWQYLTDGTPRIVTGTGWYFDPGSPWRGRNIVGGRQWVTAGHAGKVIQLTLWVSASVLPGSGSGINLAGTPLRTKNVTVTDNGAHWLAATWDTPVTISTTDYLLYGVASEITSNAGAYFAGSNTRSTAPTLSVEGGAWFWAEAGTPNYAGNYFRQGTTSGLTAIQTSYGQDILIDDGTSSNVAPTANAGVDQSVTVNTQVTLNGSGSTDSDGTIASYSWTQVSGTTVSLSGSGASRTFTPTAAGTYVFGLTVTDNGGTASSQDTISVVVTAPGASYGATVALENDLTGVAASAWYEGVGSEQMPAFSRSTYYLPGQTANFSVDYNSAFTVDIFRLGHYQGGGARKVDTVSGTPTAQPAASVIADSNGAVTCAAWSVNASWAVPSNATPGWYYALLRGGNGTSFGHVLFCVSDKAAKKPILIITGDATWHAAYNGYGGNNVYGAAKGLGAAITSRALCSTYDKPVITRDYVPQTHFLNNTFPYLKWSERMGIDAAHTTIEQIKNDPTIVDGRELLVFVGHNEYIPQNVYDKIQNKIVNDGQRILNLAGNDFFWRVKFTDGAFDSTSGGRVMWCKKDTMAGPGSHVAGQPFTTQADWTGTWQDTRYTNRRPTENVFGDRFIANGVRADQVKVPFAMKSSPAWRNCGGIQALTSGQTYSFLAGSLGMEWDMPVTTNGNVEQALFSSSTVDLTGNASDINGEDYSTTVANAVHGFSMVRNNAALIANFNSDQWSWALDGLHLRTPSSSFTGDANAMQMMLNVIADMTGRTGRTSSVTAAGLTQPTAVSEVYSAYGLTAPAAPPTTTSLTTRVRTLAEAIGADAKTLYARTALGMPTTRSLDGSDDAVTDITIIDDGSPTTNWPNRWTWSFGTTLANSKLVNWINEYGELRLVPAKVNTVALRIFAKTTPQEADHSGNVFEIQDNRNDRNNVFAVDGVGNGAAAGTFTAKNIAQKVRTVPTGTTGFATEPDGTLWIEYTP